MVNREKRSFTQEVQLIRSERKMSRAVPCAWLSIAMLTGCTVEKTPPILSLDFGVEGKVLTTEEVLEATYIDKEAINYKEGDSIRLYYVKDGEVFYEIDRATTDQDLIDALKRYQSLAGIFGRIYEVGIGQRVVEGDEDELNVHFDLETGNATQVDYLKTGVTYREGGAVNNGTIESITVELAFTIREGDGMFDLNQYPEVLQLLNALREINLTQEEIAGINQQAQRVIMNALTASDHYAEENLLEAFLKNSGSYSSMSEEVGEVESTEQQLLTEDSFTIVRGAYTETFRTTPEAPHQMIFTMTLTDWSQMRGEVPEVVEEVETLSWVDQLALKLKKSLPQQEDSGEVLSEEMDSGEGYIIG